MIKFKRHIFLEMFPDTFVSRLSIPFLYFHNILFQIFKEEKSKFCNLQKDLPALKRKRNKWIVRLIQCWEY